MVLGIFTILFGGFCGMMAGFVTWAPSLPAAAGPGNRWQTILPALWMYGGLAVALVWLGVGSILARRWARALLLIFSWTMLVIGLLTVVLAIVLLPQTFALIHAMEPDGQTSLPPAAIRVMVVIPVVFMTLFLVVVPTIGVIFYRSPHVKATCEARDPVRRWTDACPLPVLAVALWLAVSTPMMLMLPLMYGGMFPVFGVLATGLAATAAALMVAAIWAWCAWAFYRLDFRGWWLLVITLVLFALSTILTYSRHDLMELYERMGYSEEQLELFRQVSFLSSAAIGWFTGGWAMAILGYLWYIRRYFPRSKPVSPATVS